MSEEEVVSTEQQSIERAVSAGKMLREAREARQISISTLASSLKVPVAKLQALEEDRWDVLTDNVFTRALALSVCRVLQIDSVQILSLLPKAGAAKLSKNPEGINEPFKDKTLRSSMSSSSDGSGSGAVKLLAALLIAAAGGAAIYFVPQWGQESGMDLSADAVVGGAAGDTALVPEPLVVAAPVVPAAPAAVEVAPAAIAQPSVVVSGTGAATVSAASDNAAQAASTSAQTAVPVSTPVAQPETAPVVADGSSVLRFAATGETWVQVRNAQQKVVVEKILKAGDVYEQTAAGRPFQVVIGNADVTRLEIDGAAFDWTGTTKNNVARFEVK